MLIHEIPEGHAGLVGGRWFARFPDTEKAVMVPDWAQDPDVTDGIVTFTGQGRRIVLKLAKEST